MEEEEPEEAILVYASLVQFKDVVFGSEHTKTGNILVVGNKCANPFFSFVELSLTVCQRFN